MLDELPSLEFAATAVALVLVLRAATLSRGGAGLLQRRSRVESGRARDLIGIVILLGAVLYAMRTERASVWFLAASGVAVVAQVVGFYFRSSARARAAAPPIVEIDAEGDDGSLGCLHCGNADLLELTDTERLLSGLSRFTRVAAAVCPRCGALTGHVEEPEKIPVGEEHGTRLQQSPSDDEGNTEALEEPQEHQG